MSETVVLPWQPVNDAERAMADALIRGDRREYFRRLAQAELYLPVDPTPDGNGEPELIAARLAGLTYLMAFTSLPALTARLGTSAPGFRVTDYAQLRATWPDPAWRLAVNPDLPLDAYVSIDTVAAAAAGERFVPTGSQLSAAALAVTAPPANDDEEALLAALEAQDVDAYVEALLHASVLVPTTEPVKDLESILDGGFPWRRCDTADSPVVAVFTSAARLGVVFAPPVPTVTVAFLLVLAGLPSGWRLLVNPGTGLEVELESDQLAALLLWPGQDADEPETG